MDLLDSGATGKVRENLNFKPNNRPHNVSRKIFNIQQTKRRIKKLKNDTINLWI